MTLDERMTALRANVAPKLRMSEADINQAGSIYSDAHRAKRDDIKREIRAMLDSDERQR